MKIACVGDNCIDYYDDSGHFRIDIPLADQQEVKPIRIEMQGYKPYERKDESPNKELSYLMFH